MIFGFLLNPFSSYLKSLIIPVVSKDQARYIVLKQDQCDVAVDRQITLIFTGNAHNINDFNDEFQREWLTNQNIFPASENRIYVMPGYDGLDADWTEETIGDYVLNKKAMIERELQGTVDHIYGHSMGGYFAAVLYKELQKNNEGPIVKLTLDRTFAEIEPLVTRKVYFEWLAEWFLESLDINLMNPLLEPDVTWVNADEITVIDSVCDHTIPHKHQLGPKLRAEDGKLFDKIHYFKLTDERTEDFLESCAHSVGLGLDTTVLTAIVLD